jgi:hypothetical protein
MNGRVQDPMLGRFSSADPSVSAPYSSGSLNRYAYVWNNLMSMVDPSGFGPCAWFANIRGSFRWLSEVGGHCDASCAGGSFGGGYGAGGMDPALAQAYIDKVLGNQVQNQNPNQMWHLVAPPLEKPKGTDEGTFDSPNVLRPLVESATRSGQW